MVSTRARSYSRRAETARLRAKAVRTDLKCEREESARLVALYKSQTVLKRRAKEKVRLLSADLARAKEQHATDADRIDDLQTSCEGFMEQLNDRAEDLRDSDELVAKLRKKIKEYEDAFPKDWPSNPRLPLGSNISLPPAATDTATATAAKEIADYTLNPPPILSALRGGSPVPVGPLFPDTPPKVLSPSGSVRAGTPTSPRKLIGVERLFRTPTPTKSPRWSPLCNDNSGVSDLFV